MDFNKERFLNFGRYDLIINKSFYRTMALICIFGSTGIAFVAFFGRWLMANAFHRIDIEQLQDFWSYKNVTITALVLIMFTGIMHVIFAGCTFHNLRNKQGRISELTLPATNLEKYAWHLGLVIIGGTLAIILSLVCSDALNALLNLIFHPLEYQNSIIYSIYELMSFRYTYVNGTSLADMEEMQGLLSAIRFMSIAMSVSGFAFFVLGNAIKYKYNIILTYITFEFSMSILTIIAIFIIKSLAENDSIQINSREEALAYVKASANIVAILNYLLTVLYFWLSYKLYKKAQITSGWNK